MFKASAALPVTAAAACAPEFSVAVASLETALAASCICWSALWADAAGARSASAESASLSTRMQVMRMVWGASAVCVVSEGFLGEGLVAECVCVTRGRMGHRAKYACV